MDLTGKRTVIDLAGHGSRQKLQRYSHIRAKSKVDAVNALNKGYASAVFLRNVGYRFLPAGIGAGAELGAETDRSEKTVCSRGPRSLLPFSPRIQSANMMRSI